MSFLSRKILPSIRSKTATLVLACALPAIVGIAALCYDSYVRERDNLLRDAEWLAQSVMLAVERDLDAGQTAARALASSPSLASGKLRDFHAQARSILGPDFPGFAFVLSDTAGVALMHTRVAYGMPLPPNGNVDAIRKVAATNEPFTSDLHRAGPGQPWVISVDVPVQVQGVVAYVLSVQLRPERVAQLLAEQRLPPRWTAQLLDARHVFVARTALQDQYIGTAAQPALVDSLKRSDAGMAELTSRQGVHVFAIHQRSLNRQWHAVVGVPRDAALAALRDSLANVILFVIVLLVIGFATAWTIGGVIGRSVRALCAPAAALGRGEPVLLPPASIREAAEVGAALKQVEGELYRYRHQLETLVAERTAKLETANALIENVYATAPVGLSLLDTELRVVMVNDYLAALNAKPVSAHIGRTLPELLGPIGVEYEKAYRKVRDTGLPLTAIEDSGPVPAEPGVERHWIVSYYPVFGPDHALVGISAVVLDVSERKEMSEQLRDVNEQFRAIYEMSGDAHMLIAQGAGFISGNQAAAKIFGCASTEEFMTLSPASASPEFQPDGRRSADKAEQFVRYALEHGSHHFEWLHQRRNGSLFTADVLLTSLNIGGKGVLQATVRDISERVAADKALRATSARLEQSERFIRTVTDNVPGMVGYWDADLRCRFANRRYLAWFGRGEQDMLGLAMDQILTPEALAENAPYVREVLAGREAHFARELAAPGAEPNDTQASHQTQHTWTSFIPDFDQQGAVRGFFVLVSDVSELKRTELRLQSLNEQLRTALERAEAASIAKGEFLANMSHEIRTPMNAIMGLARLLEEGRLERRERSYVSKMMMSTRSLMGILSDVLDFSKIEAGQLMLEYTSFKLCQVLDSMAVLVAASAWGKGVELVYVVGPDIPLILVGDPMRLEQVLLNLIGNAIKFTEQGEVVLEIGKRSESADTIVLDFTVRDTGIGIDAARQEHMFDAFSQGDSSTGRKYGGTGLGLAICRRLVSLMGSAIGVTSTLGGGAEFRFDCSFGVHPMGGDIALPPMAELSGRSILIVDDNRSARHALVTLCKWFGWRVQEAAGGAEALELLRAARRDERPIDFMLLDTAMPDLDGIAVLTYARADPAIDVPRCALMVADSAREQLDGLAQELGLDAILSKPFTPDALVKTLVELQSGRPAPDASAALAPLAGRLQGIYVLLVEDNQINQEVANYILLHAGAAVDIASNGRIAVSMLAEAPTRYDAVLMDIQMPVMNGYQATAAIRAMGLDTLPIIAMTANAMEADRQLAIEAGMSGHVPKPIDVDNLVAALNKVTSGGDARELRAPARAGYSYGVAAHEMSLPAHVPGVDLRSTLPRFGGNYASFVNLFKRFESSQGGTLAEVDALLRRQDRHGAITLVHRLRGVAANLGAVDLAALAFELEHALRGAGEAELSMRIDTLDKALHEVFATARALPVPASSGPALLTGQDGGSNGSGPGSGPGSGHGGWGDARAPALEAEQFGAALENLLILLQNNNLKAMAAFDALRPALAQTLETQAMDTLGEAIATLGFAGAAVQVRAIMTSKGL